MSYSAPCEWLDPMNGREEEVSSGAFMAWRRLKASEGETSKE